MISNKKILRNVFMGLLFGILLMTGLPVTASSADDYLSSMNAGAAIALDADITLDKEEVTKLVEKAAGAAEVKQEEPEESTLVMANVKESVNVREDADESSDKTGQLYKDCGGDIIERNSGWTKIRSGKLEGWVKDEYLLFGTEAEALAGEVGNLVAKANTDALRVRKSTNDSADMYGLMAVNDEVIAIENLGDWVSVDFDGQTGYVSSDYVSVKFKIDSGETIETINERAKKEAEQKAKLSENRGAVPEGLTETTLLAALIQCESGGESYEGQVAVGAVVMNRLRSGGYPNSMQGVIYASGQFTPAMNGKVARVAEKGPKASCIQAAQEAINGASNVGGATHFKRAGSHDGIVIGNHVFW